MKDLTEAQIARDRKEFLKEYQEEGFVSIALSVTNKGDLYWKVGRTTDNTIEEYKGYPVELYNTFSVE